VVKSVGVCEITKLATRQEMKEGANPKVLTQQCQPKSAQPYPRAPVHRVARLLRRRRGVAVQVEAESKGLKRGFHFI
jgi:hypothetical protein